MAEQFAQPTEDEIKSLIENKTPKNTKKATRFGMVRKTFLVFPMIIWTDFYQNSTVSVAICRFVYSRHAG